jgi:hypothetical protein
VFTARYALSPYIKQIRFLFKRLKIGNIESLGVFERRILRTIYGPTKEGDEWRIQNNKHLYDLYKDEHIVTFIKLGRLRWTGHVIRMEEDRPAKRILVSNTGGARRRGRRKIRREYGVDDDSKAIGVRNCKSVALNGETWDNQLRKALAFGRLLHQ